MAGARRNGPGAAREMPPNGGFLRTSPPPPPTSVARLRASLMAAAAGQPASVREGLSVLGTWEDLPLLMTGPGPWFAPHAGLARDSAASRRSLQRRLRLLGTRTISVAAATALSRGQLVALTGKARIPPGKAMSYIWVNSETNNGNVRLLVEEGHDFFLEEPCGDVALVSAVGGHLVEGNRVNDGDGVVVIGFVDRVVDPRAAAPAGGAREPPQCLAISSGDELALLVRRRP